MPVKDQIKNLAKKLVEEHPDAATLRALVRARKPVAIHFRDDGVVPNNPHFPLLHYRGAVNLKPRRFAPEVIIDTLFDANGWGRSWRDTVYDFVHYHSQVHEVMGVARGTAKIECGGIKGRVLRVKAGDVLVLPAGIGHRLIEASRDFLVVGAYPRDGTYDECTDTRERPDAIKRITKVRRPKTDPVLGRNGPLRKSWRTKPRARG
ncbi:cupin [Bradyrhizobium sp. 159]|uniref:cupin n=1 Tax=Bradyrhizobium sp. 159 TaxID=2782632 RepID=UPI001FF76EFD|nr:cupin [Bradyrhizobium sp. 159]MCK1619821.1 cupin [Bradyrhizobium sp. 159]